MKKTHVLQEIRTMRFKEVYEKRAHKKLSVEQAAELLGVNERTFRRWSERYEEEGAAGLIDQRLDKIAHNAAPVDEVMALTQCYQTQYQGWNVSHFFDRYRDEGGQRSYSWVKNQLQAQGAVIQAKQRGVHRRKRPRKPMVGMMLHQDGSTHQWIPGVYWDLIVTMDDADSHILSAFFVEEEGTWSSLRGVSEVISQHGLFCSLYVDRGSHYFHTPKAGGKVDKHNPTQFGRALQQLGIELIPAYSPEARGRSERLFGTLQGRLPQELAQQQITTMDAANHYLHTEFIPRFNQRFGVEPEDTDSAFVPYLGAPDSLNDILCLYHQRQVNRDNTVSFNKLSLQLPANTDRKNYYKTHVRIHEYADGRLAIFHGPRRLAEYDNTGALKTTSATQRTAA
jgi:transposase